MRKLYWAERVSAVALLVAAIATTGITSDRPLAVSPGDGSGTVIAGSCPTFSWGVVADATSYDLVAYQVPNGLAVGSRLGDLEELWRVTLPGSARSWTPPADRCFKAGGSYAWAVRAVVGREPGAWSEANLFTIDKSPSAEEAREMMARMRGYLLAKSEQGSHASPIAGPRSPGSSGRDAFKPRSKSAAGGRGVRVGGLLVASHAPATMRRARRRSGLVSVSKRVATPTLGSPSLSVDGNLSLGSSSSVFKDGKVLLWNDTSGNMALGRSALTSISGNATYNTALGNGALMSTSGTASFEDGSFNTAAGFYALNSNTVGHWNSAHGFEALASNMTGSENTAIGGNALEMNESGGGNTAVGFDALFYQTSGARNTAIGSVALLNNSGSDNIAVGYFAGADATTGSHNIFIGHDGHPGDSHVIRIGTLGVQTTASIAGDLGVGTESPGNRLQVVDSINAAATAGNHVALIENTSTGTSADVLALRVAGTSPGVGQNFITFLDGTGGIGAIEGNGSGGIELKTNGADFAEYLPSRGPSDRFLPGQVLGLTAGRVGLETSGADRLLVVTTAPALVGAALPAGELGRSGEVAVALLGQVPVRVRGSVAVGDLLVASGLDDGYAVAWHPSRIGEVSVARPPIPVGRAIEGSDRPNGRVRALVGAPEPAELIALIAAQEADLESQAKQIRSQNEALAALRAELSRLEAHLASAAPQEPRESRREEGVVANKRQR